MKLDAKLTKKQTDLFPAFDTEVQECWALIGAKFLEDVEFRREEERYIRGVLMKQGLTPKAVMLFEFHSRLVAYDAMTDIVPENDPFCNRRRAETEQFISLIRKLSEIDQVMLKHFARYLMFSIFDTKYLEKELTSTELEQLTEDRALALSILASPLTYETYVKRATDKVNSIPAVKGKGKADSRHKSKLISHFYKMWVHAGLPFRTSKGTPCYTMALVFLRLCGCGDSVNIRKYMEQTASEEICQEEP